MDDIDDLKQWEKMQNEILRHLLRGQQDQGKRIEQAVKECEVAVTLCIVTLICNIVLALI